MPRAITRRRNPSTLSRGGQRRDLLRESHRFETLVTKLSGAFVRATVASIDQEIEQWLKRIVLTLGLDRSTVFQAGPDGKVHVSHQWARPGLPRTPGFTNVREVAPWATATVLSGRIFQFSRLDELPHEAARDRETFRRNGNKSNLTVPVRIGETVVGGVAFGTLRRERSWPSKVVRRLEVIAQIFGFALERKKTVAETLLLRRELTRASRVAAMGELAASLAHELNPPLTAIRSNARTAQRLLGAEEPALEEVREAFQDIIQNCSRAAKTIRSVLLLFRRARRAKSTAGLGEQLNELERILRTDATIRSVALGFEDKALLGSAGRVAERTRELRVAQKDLAHLKRLHGSLTPRERQVFALVAAGLPSRQVGNELGIAEKTIKVHRGRVMEKMNAESLADLVRMAIRLGV